MSSRIEEGSVQGTSGRKSKKYFTWYDINRILKNMESPGLSDLHRADRNREYYALLGSYLRMVAHFVKVQAQQPMGFFKDKKKYQGFIEALGEAAAVVSEVTADIIEDDLT